MLVAVAVVNQIIPIVHFKLFNDPKPTLCGYVLDM